MKIRYSFRPESLIEVIVISFVVEYGLIQNIQYIVLKHSQRLMLRIAPQHHAGIQYKLNKKFGCSLIKVRTLLHLAKDLGLNVKGVR